MPVILFRAPAIKDKRVYATAGDTHSILSVARANAIQIPYECQEGECGSCLIRIEYVDGKTPMAISLTEKEKAKLQELKKITPEQIRDAEINDIPPPYRLACQYIAREEEIVVHYNETDLEP